ncbi:MAG: TonB-dependent receptor plug domain-containing protein [Gammaproteobacteria bacterium]|nr:TonB-dependent receptor plug domain-containing protein [Gammaproteobacteria bacterium]
MNTVGQLINRSQTVTGARRIIVALLTLTIGFSSNIVVAQDSLEEIVVTAQRREQSLQDVPISINAFSSRDIEANMFDDVTDFVTRTPNISWSSTGSRSRRELSIRGTTNFLNVNSTLRSNTFAFYEDDFSIGGSSGNPPLMDIERIEVLRGPQATYFGRNAMGGGISVTTNKPNAEEIEGSIMFDYSNFDTKDVEAVVNVPVIEDVLALRGNIKYYETDGNIKNIQPDDQGNDQKNKYARLAARWTPNDDLTVDIIASVGSEVTGMRQGIGSGVLSFFGERLFGGDATNGFPDADGNGVNEGLPDGVGFFPNNTNRTNFGDPQEVGLNYRQIVGRIDYEWNNLLFTSITGHIDSNFFLNGDIDGVSINAFQEYRDIKRDSVSQEFRIQNTDDGRMRWSIGGIWAKDSGFFDSETFAGPDNAFGLPGGTGGEQINQGFNFPNNNTDESIESIAIFGQFEFDFTERLTLSVGGRWAEEDPSYVEIADDGTIVSDVKSKFKSFSPRFAVNYAMTEDINHLQGVQIWWRDRPFECCGAL